MSDRTDDDFNLDDLLHPADAFRVAKLGQPIAVAVEVLRPGASFSISSMTATTLAIGAGSMSLARIPAPGNGAPADGWTIIAVHE